MENKKSEESEKWLNETKDGAKIVSEVHTTRRTYGSAAEITNSYFDIAFQPTEEVTHKTVWPQILACISAASFHFPIGLIIGFSAIMIPQLQDPNSDIKVTKEAETWIASLVVLVVPLIAPLTGYLVDRIGRLNVVKLSSLPYLLGWLLIATSWNLPMILGGRFLTGFALAMGTSPAVVYITEVARPDLRGALICMGPSMTSLGMVIVYTKGAFLHWRTISWMAMGYCLLPLLFMTLWSPESPVWLISKGKTQQALKSLTYLSRNEKQAGVPERQLADLLREHNAKTPVIVENSISRLFHAFLKPTGFKPLFLLLSLFFFQNFTGVYITIFYAVNFFQDVGANLNAYVSTVLIGLVRMIIGLLTSYLLRQFGRRPLYMISGTGMAISMGISGYFTREIVSGRMESSFIPVVCVVIYMSLSVTGLMSIPWTMTAELYPIEIRGMAQGLTVSLAHIIMFSALKSYHLLIEGLGGMYAVQWMFSAISVSSVIFVFIFLPETHKRLLSDIQEYFVHNTIYLLSKDKKPVPTIIPMTGNLGNLHTSKPV